MPLFAIIAEDKPDGIAHRMAVRPAHLEHMRALGDVVVLAGALLDGDAEPAGSLVVIEAEDLSAARAIAERDPYVTRGVFASYAVKRWNWTLNNPAGRGQ